jgi:hypothetical protein
MLNVPEEPELPSVPVLMDSEPVVHSSSLVEESPTKMKLSLSTLHTLEERMELILVKSPLKSNPMSVN